MHTKSGLELTEKSKGGRPQLLISPLALAISITLLPWHNAVSIADEYKMPGAQIANCGLGRGPINSIGVYWDQKYCNSSAWLVEMTSGSIYLCSAQHVVSNLVQRNKIISSNEGAAASCSLKYKLPPANAAIFIPDTFPFEDPGVHIAAGWATTPIPSTVKWSTAQSNFDVTACIGMHGNPEFITCIPAVMK